MKLDEIIALARQCQGVMFNTAERRLADAVLALLTAESPCIASVDDIVRVDSDGYITIYQNECMRADEAAWAAVEVLRAVERAKEQGNG